MILKVGFLIKKYLFRFFGGGSNMEEEERVVKGNDVIVDLDATLEDLYMGGSLKVLNMSVTRKQTFTLLNSRLMKWCMHVMFNNCRK